ncbi:MAG: oligosaccharide flippase family protein [Bacteroidetes bacterium]|nr:oligosaccharide flippase family protein [Bacteroidota bacterium]
MSIIKKALSLFKNIHFQSLLGNGVMGVVGMLTVAILYRALSIKEVGIYVFLMAVVGFVDTFKGGFLTNSFLKFYVGTEEKRAREVLGSAWILGFVTTGFLVFLNLIGLFFYSKNENEVLRLFLKYFGLISLSTLPFFMANLVVQGEKRFDRLLYMRLINQVLFITIVVVLIFLHKGSLDSIIIAYIFSNAVASLATLLFGWTKFKAIKYYTRKSFLELFHFGKYSMATSLSSNLFSFTDVFFINLFLAPAALAVYNLGYKLIQVIEIPLLSFAASGLPIMSAHYNNNQNDQMVYTMKKIIGMLTMAVIVIAIFSIIFAEPLIAIVGGNKYIHSEAPNLFRIFIIIAILYPADRFFSITLDVIHKPQVNFYKILVMLLLNLAADYIGVIIFKSTYAIAVANIFPVLAAVIISYISINKYYKFSFWDIYKVGYRESILLIKKTLSNLKFSKNGKKKIMGQRHGTNRYP